MSGSNHNPDAGRTIGNDGDVNYVIFRDCLCSALLKPMTPDSASLKKQSRRRRREKAHAQQAAADTQQDSLQNAPERLEELSDFADYLARSIFDAFPAALKTLSHRSWRESRDLQEQFSLPLTPESLSELDFSPPVPETLVAYHLVAADFAPHSDLPATTEHFMMPILTSYIETLTRPPPASWATRTEACEICERDWIPLSYHHLIPRAVHEKVVKRGWHQMADLQNVAWLCGACHRFVHNFKSHEQLAREYYTVDLLLAADEVQKFASWVGRLRWKGGQDRPRVH